MNASTQSQTGGTRHPKSFNSPKAATDDTASGSRSLCGLHVLRFRKTDRADLAPENLPIKQDPDPCPTAIEEEAASSGTDVDAAQEISEIIELGGLTNPEIVEKMLELMQLDRKERKIDLKGRVMLAGIIADTDTANIDCLVKFMNMKGVTILDEWLQESHKGTKQGEHSNSKAVEELLLALLRALEKLPINLGALRTCNIGKSVNKLKRHKNLEVQSKARFLVDVWKRRVDEEMKMTMDLRISNIFDSTITYSDDDQIILPQDSGTKRPTVPGRVQLIIRNSDKAPLKENIQKVMLELTGEETSRSGLDLVAVLNLNSSLEGFMLAELKKAMLFLAKKLTVVDRLSIVTYSIEVERLCPLRQMTESFQTKLEDIINDLEVQPSMNITDGILAALKILKDRSVHSGRFGAIILMSGSQDNWLSNVAAVLVGNVPVHTFGFGDRHNPKMLKAIAYNSLGGTYSDVRKINLSLAFAQCLGGLLSVVAHDLTVTINQIKDESTIKQVSAGSYPQSMDNVAGSVTIKFGHIYNQETRKALVELHLPATKKKQSADVLEVSYTYMFDGESFQSSPETVIVCRKSGLGAEEQQALQEVRVEEVRLLIAEAIKEATADADDDEEKDLKSAQDKLANCLLELEDPDIEKLKAELRPELEELLKLMQMTQAIYERQALPFAYSLLISLAAQRKTARGNNISKFQLFATPIMQEFLEEAKKLHDIDDHKQYGIDPYTKSFNDDDPTVLPLHSSRSGSNTIVHGKLQLEINNNNNAPLEENMQKVLLELSGVENTNRQFGLDIVAVLDVSSSMEGVKLAKMKIALLLLMNNLSHIDRLSIVKYSSRAQRLCPLLQMNGSSKEKLENLIDDLKAQPGSNITDGLEMALNVLKNRSVSSGRVGVIMLMSDGEQNLGGDAADVPVGNFPVLTFGFGEDQNPEVLIAITNNSEMGGTYAEVCMDNLSLTFAHCLDELPSVVVWDLTVTVTQIKNESTIKRASAGRYLQSIDNAAGSVTITFGTLYLERVCNVLVDILLPVTKNEHEADILKVSYTYRSSFDGELCEAMSATVTVHRMSELSAEQQQRPPLLVTNFEARLLIAELIKHATGAADKEDLKSVQNKLVHSLKTLGPNNDLFYELNMLREELDGLCLLMQSQEINEKQGRSFEYSLLISNFTKRQSTRDIDPIMSRSELFDTPAMREFLEEAKMYDEIDDLHVYIDRFICAVESIEMIMREIED